MKEEEIVQKVNDHFGDQIPITKEEIAYFCYDLVWDAEILAEARAQAQYPTKQAKEIALEAAVNFAPTQAHTTHHTTENLIKNAEAIYQWLISDSIKQDKP